VPTLVERACECIEKDDAILAMSEGSAMISHDVRHNVGENI
jgi:hypothetical protein